MRIKFLNKNKSEPYCKFYSIYEKAIKKNQKSIDAVCISSFNASNNEVDSRFVNLKFIDNQDWVFFSNYESKKARDFEDHDQISALIYWNSINTQIRIKAKISKLDEKISDNYFSNRSSKKNALAIMSEQSKEIESYDAFVKKYNSFFDAEDSFSNRPSYWGGYFFRPYYIELWEGHPSRLNKREVHMLIGKEWEKIYLQP